MRRFRWKKRPSGVRLERQKDVLKLRWFNNVKIIPSRSSSETTRQPTFRVPNILAVGVGSLLPAEGSDDVDEATIVLNATSGASRLLLFLLLLLHLGRLSLDFAGTSQRTVDFASEKTARHLDGCQLVFGWGMGMEEGKGRVKNVKGKRRRRCCGLCRYCRF